MKHTKRNVILPELAETFSECKQIFSEKKNQMFKEINAENILK